MTRGAVGLCALALAACGASGQSASDAGVSPRADAATGPLDARADSPGGHIPEASLADAPAPPADAGAALSRRYPCDKGLASDPAVLFAEAFDEPTVAALTARYEQSDDPAGMALVTDVPVASCGGTSVQLTSSATANATDFYKTFAPTDEVWVRWYVKYQAGVTWHHTGMWFGGYNPSTPYPSPHAGLLPAGDDRFSIGIEPVWGVGSPNPRLDTYDYWMQMHSWMAVPSGTTAYYGNAVIHQNSFTADDDAWICLEAHAKMNTDLTSGTGAELDVWKNDALVAHFDDHAPLGYWMKDKFCPVGAPGTECTSYPPDAGTVMIPLDLQWRKTQSLALTYIWPQNYITTGSGTLGLDAMVVASARIGCMQP